MERLRYWPTAWALGGFLAVSYVVCVAWDGLFPSLAMRGAWQDLLPGFSWLSWGSFFLGLAEATLYGFWLALLVPTVAWSHRLAGAGMRALPASRLGDRPELTRTPHAPTHEEEGRTTA